VRLKISIEQDANDALILKVDGALMALPDAQRLEVAKALTCAVFRYVRRRSLTITLGRCASSWDVTGTVASKYYDKAGDVVGHVPLLKTSKPVAKWASRCFGSKTGKIGGTLGAGAAVLTGSASLAWQAGSAAATGCAGETAINTGRSVYKGAVETVKKDWRDIKNSANQKSIQ
jgi:hypothetical protein